jgi:hypothetical protein
VSGSRIDLVGRRYAREAKSGRKIESILIKLFAVSSVRDQASVGIETDLFDQYMSCLIGAGVRSLPMLGV